MTTLTERIDRCFQNVFPGIRPELADASPEGLKGWDSIAHVTLLSSLSEECGFDLELEHFEDLTSHPRIVEHLEKKFPDA
jgi:acyl carrier protein